MADLTKVVQKAVGAASNVGAVTTITLRRTVTTHDEATGMVTTTATDYSWAGVMVEYADGLVDGQAVLMGDRMFLGAAGDIAVTPSSETDTVIEGGKTHTIVRVKRDPAGVLWTLQVRR